MTHEILLDSGTNEVEILEFFLGEQSFGLNVAKVMQILEYEQDKHTHVPDESPAMLGVYTWHQKTIPLIDLHVALGRKGESKSSPRPLVLVTRFNDVVNAFMVSSVNRIHRINWGQIESTNPIISHHSSNITGSVSIEKKDILLVDFEFIIAELFPETNMSYAMEESQDQPEEVDLVRADAKIVFAEDSAFIRASVLNLLKQVGYSHVDPFENGLEAYEHIQELAAQAEAEEKPITNYLNLVITDIEMPKMDGLTLCKKIKHELNLTEVQVAVFSSLIDDQMTTKCQEVGADVFTTKPKINKLVDLIDSLLKITQ